MIRASVWYKESAISNLIAPDKKSLHTVKDTDYLGGISKWAKHWLREAASYKAADPLELISD